MSSTSLSVSSSKSNNPNNNHDNQHQQQQQQSTTSTKPKEIICTICQEKFPSRSQLFKHLRLKHENLLLMDNNDDNSAVEAAAIAIPLPPSRLQNLSPEERTAASIEARGKYSNSAHDGYYRKQIKAGLFRNNNNNEGEEEEEEEATTWETTMEYFRKPLPVSFRLLKRIDPIRDGIRYQCWKQLQRLVPPNALESIESLPSGLAQVAVIPTRQWSPSAQQALIDAQEIGVANRQEICSMIPPLLLLQADNDGVLERGTVLDLCAAPGSKSLQIMDQMMSLQMKDHPHNNAPTTMNAMGKQQQQQQENDGNDSNNDITQEEGDDDDDTGGTTTTKSSSCCCGSDSLLLVCNDTNIKRLLIVARRSRRQSAIQRQCLVLNCSDGRYFPALRKWGGYKVKFDRVLADVPCSGDGTLRKLSSKEWQEWNVKSHLQLHKLQVRLLTRALESVGKGGRVVYSTCSLDPIEDEAVLVTAIARRGGPNVYRIVPIPTHLSKDTAATTTKFEYSRGATRWIVPHPQFGKTPKRSNKKQKKEQQVDNNNGNGNSTTTTLYDTYESIDQVPKGLRKKEISPSMFPPHSRTLENVQQIWQDEYQDDFEKVQEKLQHAKFYGEILTQADIALYEEMLPNCGRILPQHLDSGGFFCAIIERIAPVYYPVCYPVERSRREEQEKEQKKKEQAAASTTTSTTSVGEEMDLMDTTMTTTTTSTNGDTIYKYHGRILTNVTSAKHMREVVAEDKHQNDDVCFEGVATLDLALEWLKKHRAYQESLSEEVLQAPPGINDNDNDDCSDDDDDDQDKSQATTSSTKTPFKKAYVNDPTRSPLYTRLFPSPHPSLIAEFCDFFGLISDPIQAQNAGVDVFPVHRLVVTGGGGDDAVTVTTCLEPSEAHTLIRREDPFPKDAHVYRKRRFFQLSLVSDEARNLFKGGAKFNPMEVGLTLCWVSIKGYYRETTEDGGSRRAVESGRYGILDEAAEYLGWKATKRILAFTKSQALELLESSSVPVTKKESINTAETSPWWRRWGKQQLQHTLEWSPGAVIVAVACSPSGDPEQSTLFLPCVLKGNSGEEGRQIEVLAEKKLTDVWMRVLQSL